MAKGTKKTQLPGINIQRPWAELLTKGDKTIETRSYPIPQKYMNRPLAIIETPGDVGGRIRRVVGIITFSGCFRYENSRQFNKDYRKHRVPKESKFHWDNRQGRDKWGWIVKSVKQMEQELPEEFRTGIIFSISVPLIDTPLAY